MSYSQEEADLLKENARLRAENEALQGVINSYESMRHNLEAAEAKVLSLTKDLSLTQKDLNETQDREAALAAKVAQMQGVVEAAKVLAFKMNDHLTAIKPGTFSAADAQMCREVAGFIAPLSRLTPEPYDVDREVREIQAMIDAPEKPTRCAHGVWLGDVCFQCNPQYKVVVPEPEGKYCICVGDDNFNHLEGCPKYCPPSPEEAL